MRPSEYRWRIQHCLSEIPLYPKKKEPALGRLRAPFFLPLRPQGTRFLFCLRWLFDGNERNHGEGTGWRRSPARHHGRIPSLSEFERRKRCAQAEPLADRPARHMIFETRAVGSIRSGFSNVLSKDCPRARPACLTAFVPNGAVSSLCLPQPRQRHTAGPVGRNANSNENHLHFPITRVVPVSVRR